MWTKLFFSRWEKHDVTLARHSWSFHGWGCMWTELSTTKAVMLPSRHRIGVDHYEAASQRNSLERFLHHKTIIYSRSDKTPWAYSHIGQVIKITGFLSPLPASPAPDVARLGASWDNNCIRFNRSHLECLQLSDDICTVWRQSISPKRWECCGAFVVNMLCDMNCPLRGFRHAF